MPRAGLAEGSVPCMSPLPILLCVLCREKESRERVVKYVIILFLELTQNISLSLILRHHLLRSYMTTAIAKSRGSE